VMQLITPKRLLHGLTQVKPLINEVKTLTGNVNHLTGQVNSLTGQVNILTGQVNSLTGQVNDLTSHVSAFPGEDHLSSPANAAGLPGYATDRAIAADPGPVAVRRPRRGKFLIVGNMRTGSTWLETLLGGLPDVVTEFEFKWRPRYSPLAVHRVLDTGSPIVDQTLEEFESDLPVVGSKLVLDPIYLSPIEFKKLKTKLGPELRIIHLTRDLHSIFLSRRRGVYHRFNHESSIRVSDQLKAAIDDADISRAGVHPSPERVAKSDCYDELAIYVRNDVRFAELARTHPHYLPVDYDEIAERLTEIARFIGSEAGRDTTAAILENSPTAKLPRVRPEELVTNVNELAPLFAHFEALRQRFLD
jgi:hypothetical protein